VAVHVSNAQADADRLRRLRARGVEAEDLLTPSEVAQCFGVDPKTVARWAKGGKLRVTRTLSGQRRYFADEIRAMLGESK
jgi:hypothetical protein